MGNDKNQRLIDLLKILAKGLRSIPLIELLEKLLNDVKNALLFGKQELSLIN
jgi:hypothetical protein